jgi:hypothetical protein
MLDELTCSPIIEKGAGVVYSMCCSRCFIVVFIF